MEQDRIDKLGMTIALSAVQPMIGTGLLGATGATYEEAKENRLQEIERRILKIEAFLNRDA